MDMNRQGCFAERVAVAAFAALLSVCLSGGPARAHGVYIFAWPEAGRICTESYFSKSGKVRGGEVSMLDGRGVVLASGASDEAGMICFSAPGSAQDVLFVLRAGQGHRAEYLLPASAVAEALPGPAEPASPAPEAPEKQERPAARTSEAVPPLNAGPSERAGEKFPSPAAPSEAGTLEASLTPLLRTVVREELQRELAPIRQTLALSGKESGPGVKDIVGGLGWIVGLAGFGALYASRGKKG